MSREARTVIISHGSHTIRAGLGIHEVLRQPTVNLTARVGLRRSQLEGGENVKPADYLVGAILDEALRTQTAEDRVTVSWPMIGGEIRDWGGMAALWYHVLFFLLPVIRSSNSSVTLLSLPPTTITRSSSARIHKIFFDEFNTPAFCLVDSALASSFAVGQMMGTVVDVGARGSTVACVMDALMVPQSIKRCEVGLGECTAYLASQLGRDAKVVEALSGVQEDEEAIASTSSAPSSRQSRLLLALARELLAQGHVVADEASAAAGGSGAGASSDQAAEDDDGNFDVLGALTSGREKEAIAEQERRNKELVAQGKEPEPMQTAGDMAGQTISSAATLTAENGDDGGEDDDATIRVPFKGRNIRVPRSALSTALTPLVDPSVLSKVAASTDLLDLLTPLGSSSSSSERTDWSSTPSLPAAIHASISTTLDVERRNGLWEHLIVTGAPVGLVKGLTPSLVAALQRYVAAASAAANGAQGAGGPAGPAGGDDDGDDGPAGTYTPNTAQSGKLAPGQPSNVRALRTPDYFSDFKERVDLAPFLGATIYAKLVFADNQARGYVSKAGYAERGPAGAWSVMASDK